MSNGRNETKRLIKKRIMAAFEWKTFFVWRVTYICVHVTQAQILSTSSKHVSVGMPFLGLGIGGLSHQSCMSLHIGTNNIVSGSSMLTVNICLYMASLRSFSKCQPQKMTPMAADGNNKCSSYLIGDLATTTKGMNITNQIVLTLT